MRTCLTEVGFIDILRGLGLHDVEVLREREKRLAEVGVVQDVRVLLVLHHGEKAVAREHERELTLSGRVRARLVRGFDEFLVSDAQRDAEGIGILVDFAVEGGADAEDLGILWIWDVLGASNL